MENKTSVLMERYELGRLLGQGTFAKVYFARSIRTGQSVAIKIIDKDKVLRVGLVEQIKREISVMRLVRHPNILQLHEVMATKTKIYFVLEYAKGGELFNKVAKGKLKEDVARRYFQQLINAVDFCHSRGVFHRDLKPENLLLDENEDLKISDFGLSAVVESKRHDGLLHTTCGTPAYVAPEVINRKGYDGAKADTWSCGVILYVLLAGFLPFHDTNLMELYRKIGRAQYRCPSWFPPEVRKLLGKILDPNPNARISTAKIKESPWFRRGDISKSVKSSPQTKQVISSNTNSQPDSPVNCSTPSEDGQDSERFAVLNAFDIILLSPGFDLNRLFEEPCVQRESRFTSCLSPSAIISKLEEIAKRLKLKLSKREAGVLRFEGLKEGRKGVLSIDAEIFQITSEFHLVELKKSNGDTLEYQKVFNEGIRPGLQDIVFAWQSENQQPPQQLFEQCLENESQHEQKLMPDQQPQPADAQQQSLQQLVMQDKLP
ncbi:hypothetical protein LIER_22484 [Lithospermum erythrorhizon]|uniref:non-specific serine/threonine protein kinase n=1 Tax=Lithospermum erythrorhizon TaxID=34254 RepID=A0AAV3QX51_LITER